MIEILIGYIIGIITIYSINCYINRLKKPQELHTYLYDNIWFRGTVEGRDIDHAVQLFNEKFRNSNIPLVCHVEYVSKVLDMDMMGK